MGHTDEFEIFKQKYTKARSRAARRLEHAALGHEGGLNGYTTLAQAAALIAPLALSEGDVLLDVGAGRGWPGSHIARSTGCRLVSSDVPLDGLLEAKINREEYERYPEIVAADARNLPFIAESFDAVVHADVFC